MTLIYVLPINILSQQQHEVVKSLSQQREERKNFQYQQHEYIHL